jgi:hypothetical protein
MLAAIPWIAVAMIIYDIAVFAFAGAGVEGARSLMQGEILTIPLMSGARWSLGVGEAIILLALIFLFIELMKATWRRGILLSDQILSTIVLIICVLQFLMVEKAATSVFLVVTVAAFIDVIAGFVVALRPPRRVTSAKPQAAARSSHDVQPSPSGPDQPATQGSEVGQGSHG